MMTHPRGVLCLLVLAFLSRATVAHADKQYWVEQVDIVAAIGEDGAAAVTEDITYRFRGRFRYAFRDIPLDRGVAIRNIRVAENGVQYTEDDSEAPGTYHIAATGGQIRVTWYYRAHNESRSFRVQYNIAGAVRRHADVAEFYYQFIGDGWETQIANATMRVELPGRVAMSDMRAWAHGPLYGRVDLAGESRLTLRVAPLPAHTFFEGRILFPSDAVSGLPLSGEGDRMAGITAEENGLARESNRQREEYEDRVAVWREDRARKAALARRILPMSVALGLVALGVWFTIFRRVGWPHAVTSRSARGDLPSEHPPAILSYLIGRTVGGNAIVATLLDLSERGYFEVRESTEARRSLFGSKQQKNYHFDRTAKPLDDLADFEAHLVSFLTSEAGDAQGFSMLGLRDASKRRRGHFRKWYDQWLKLVQAAGKAESFFEARPVRATLVNLLLGLAVAATGVVMMIVTDSPAGVPALIGGAVAAVLSVTLVRRTPDGQRLLLAWKDFRIHLKSISRAMGPTTLDSHEWSRYLAVAVIFGMHKTVLPSLRLSGSQDESGFPVWYYAILGDGTHADSLASMADGMTAMVNSVSTTVSSSTGAGGGASSGGGGGAGGGGGGAG